MTNPFMLSYHHLPGSPDTVSPSLNNENFFDDFIISVTVDLLTPYSLANDAGCAHFEM